MVQQYALLKHKFAIYRTIRHAVPYDTTHERPPWCQNWHCAKRTVVFIMSLISQAPFLRKNIKAWAWFLCLPHELQEKQGSFVPSTMTLRLLWLPSWHKCCFGSCKKEEILFPTQSITALLELVCSRSADVEESLLSAHTTGLHNTSHVTSVVTFSDTHN